MNPRSTDGEADALTTTSSRRCLSQAIILKAGRDVQNKNILKFRLDTKLLCFSLRLEVTSLVKNFVSFRNPSNFVLLCARSQTAKGCTHPV